MGKRWMAFFLSMLFLTSCSPDRLLLRVKYPEYFEVADFKGVEIYCWQEKGFLYGGLLMGTNRLKGSEEINRLRSASLFELKEIIETYADKDVVLDLMYVQRPCGENWWNDAVEYRNSHPETIAVLEMILGI